MLHISHQARAERPKPTRSSNATMLIFLSFSMNPEAFVVQTKVHAQTVKLIDENSANQPLRRASSLLQKG